MFNRNCWLGGATCAQLFIFSGSIAAAESPAGAQKAAVLPKVRVSADAVEPDTVPESYAGGQVARGGRLGMLGNQSVMDAPFNITSYTVQTLEDQQARSIADVLVNDPSAQLSSARTNINEDFALRGFAMASQDVALNGMYGLMPFFRVPIEMAEPTATSTSCSPHSRRAIPTSTLRSIRARRARMPIRRTS